MRTKEVLRRTGVSYRRLNYWVLRGYVTPDHATPGSGYGRSWGEDDVRRIIEIRDAYESAMTILRNAGLDIPAGMVDSRLNKERRAS